MTNSFKITGISDQLCDALAKQEITIPTDIQKQTIPQLLADKDMIVCSETGSGKTLAYLLLLFMKIDPYNKQNQAIILAPTHELAIQIQREIEKLIQDSGLPITSTPCIGGANIRRQIEKLKKHPHIIVGSSGRILELMQKHKISKDIGTVIIDEADRMLDRENFDTLMKVLKKTKRSRQTALFSATIKQKTIETAKDITKDATFLNLGKTTTVNKDVEHTFMVSEQRDKIKLIRKIAAAIKPERALVFVNDNDEIETLAERLAYHGLKVVGIHGSHKKMARKQALHNFRTGKVQLLVSSDLSARGLDIKDVKYIIQYDMTEDRELYIHRAGRTGRAGKKGISIALVTAQEAPFLRKHAGYFKVKLIEKDISFGKIIDKK